MVGLLQVLRQGFTDRGVKFRAVYWKPETSINTTTQEQYAANILHCTRQLHYSSRNENNIDIMLFVNGIPVVSMELKCQFTGQSTTNAIEQYKFDRRGKEAIFAFKERILVYFAVDLTQVYMTTQRSAYGCVRFVCSALLPVYFLLRKGTDGKTVPAVRYLYPALLIP